MTESGQGSPKAQGAGQDTSSAYSVNYELPSYEQFRGWDPFQRAAYRTDIEALGPGVWEAVGHQLGENFAAAGGTPEVTRMQAGGAGGRGRAGMEMMGEIFGQTPNDFWGESSRQWSRAQAPQVKTNLNIG